MLNYDTIYFQTVTGGNSPPLKGLSDPALFSFQAISSAGPCYGQLTPVEQPPCAYWTTANSLQWNNPRVHTELRLTHSSGTTSVCILNYLQGHTVQPLNYQ